VARLDRLAVSLKKYLTELQFSLNETVANDIADAIIKEMLDMISKGISPIEGAGRFAEYKWAALARDLKAQRSQIASKLRKNQKTLFAHSLHRKNLRQRYLAAKEANRRSSLGLQATKYPFNTEEYKQGNKKLRPVNLFLTGEFLFHLQGVVTGAAGAHGVEIGFFDDKNAKKEDGHRVGVNDQPKRPIIPIGSEDFAQKIQIIIFRKIEQALDRAASQHSTSD
jgi:hypothetical protein